jgi:hypothetical protein
VVFEFNAGNHAQRRALANAAGLLAIEGLGDRVPMVTSANCLQPDGQNDNGWDQGLLFLNPSQVWLQPPGYVTQMVSRNYQPISVDLEVQSAKNALRANAKCSKDGTVLVLQVVNVSERSVTGQVHISGFSPSSPKAVTEELAAQLDAVNTSAEPDSVMPQRREWRHDLAHGRTSYSFQPYSFTILRFE